MQKISISLADINNLTADAPNSIEPLIRMFKNANGFELVHLNGNTKQDICIHYNPEVVSITNIKVIFATQGYLLNDKFKSMSLIVSNLDCADCVKVIEHVVRKLPGIISIIGSYTNSTK